MLTFGKSAIHVVKELSTCLRLVINRVIKSVVHPTSSTEEAEWITGYLTVTFLLAEFIGQHSLHNTCGHILRSFLNFYLVLNLDSAYLPFIFYGHFVRFLVQSKSQTTSLTLIQGFINLLNGLHDVLVVTEL